MKHKFTFLIILGSFWGFAQTTCTDSLKGVADYDASIGYDDGNAAAATTNYGTANQNAGFWKQGLAGPGSVNANRALLHFNMSSIPSNATITAAYLNMYALYPLGTFPGHVQGTNNDFVFQRITSAWTESTATWSNQPAVTSVNQVTVAGTTTYSLDYLNMDVTPLIKDIFAATNNYGFRIKLVTEAITNCISFCSEDYSNAAKRPYLRVYYSCSSIGIEESSPLNIACNISPNPFSDILHISLPGKTSGTYDMIIYDVTGKVVDRKLKLQEENQYSFAHLNSGIYIYKILMDLMPARTGKLIKE
jgi:hypothetical protein